MRADREGRPRHTWVRLILLLAAVGIAGVAGWAMTRRTPSPAESGYHIIIHKRQNKLYVFDDGTLQKSYPVATGKEPELTPEGAFLVTAKLELDEEAQDRDFPFGSRWIGLSVPGDSDSLQGRRYGIHGTNEPESIGKHASGGCIRMHNADVERLYESMEIGTTVYIRSGASPWNRIITRLASAANPDSASRPGPTGDHEKAPGGCSIERGDGS